MNSDSILREIEAIKRVSKTTEKIEKLRTLLKDEGFHRLVKAAYGDTRYYIKLDCCGYGLSNEVALSENARFWAILEDMAARKLKRAKVIVLVEAMSKSEAELLRRVTNKNLEGGFARATIDKAMCGEKVKGKTTFPGVMLAQPFKESRIKEYPVWVDVKHDGTRCLCVWDGKRASAFTRSGKKIETVPHILKGLEQMLQGYGPHYVDGELVGESFKEAVSNMRRKDHVARTLSLAVFDFVESGNPSLAFHERRERLLEFVNQKWGEDQPIFAVDGKICSSMDEVRAFSRECMESGLEGAMIKDIGAAYDFKRSYSWMKIKEEETLDLEVVDIVISKTGKCKGKLGALIVDYKGHQVRVGTGFSDSDREEIPTLWEDDELPMMAEVSFQSVTEAGSLRHPRFIRWREDKA